MTPRCGVTPTRAGPTRTSSRCGRVPRPRRRVIKGFAKHRRHDVDALLAVARRLVAPEIATITQAGTRLHRDLSARRRQGQRAGGGRCRLGVDPGDVLVFGDMPNDLQCSVGGLFARVAVANAHPEVLALADEVTLSNDDDGVAVYLDRMLGA